jgi:hypothetical protein
MRCAMMVSSRASDRLDYSRGLNEAVRTVIGQELRARYPAPEKLPVALLTLVHRLDDRQKQESLASFVCSFLSQQLQFTSRHTLGTFSPHRHSRYRQCAWTGDGP